MSEPSTMNQGEHMIQLGLRQQDKTRTTQQGQFIVYDRSTGETTQLQSTAYHNSTRWADAETRHLIDIWGTRYTFLKSKKRNFKDWERIAQEVYKRCLADGGASLGPRTGAQCKIRIKNILADYKRTKGEYPGPNSKQLQPFYETIEKVLENKMPQEDSSGLNEIDIDTDNIVTLQLPPEVKVIEKPQPQVLTRPIAVVSTTSPINTPFTTPIATTSAIPTAITIATTSMVPNHISLAPLHSNTENNNKREMPMIELTPGEPQKSHSTIESVTVPSNATNHVTIHSHACKKRVMPMKRSLAKNHRPYKVVKVSPRQPDNEDKVLNVVREFMEERRKREEELFDKLFQQQAEAEKRYQEFTLNVIREIGRLFRPDASPLGNSSS